MTQFVLEMYVPRDDPQGLDARIKRVRHGAEESTRAGTPVRYVRRVLLPADETCLLLYEAASPDAVRAAAERAGVPFERVVEAVTEPGADTDPAGGH